MLGAIAGDIIGSIYQADPHRSKQFELFSKRCQVTDDSVLTVAVADWILNEGDLVDYLHDYVERYPDAGYGGYFYRWATEGKRQPYQSWGNGSAMRASPTGFAASSLDEALSLAESSAEVTHDHPEGIRGAQATAAAIFLARDGADKDEIEEHICDAFGYDVSTPLDDIREEYRFDVSCQGSVPQSIRSFLEADDFEDAIRNAVSLGGDADTMACIAGGIAEAYWGVPRSIAEEVFNRLDEPMTEIVREFQLRYPSR